MSLIEIYCDPVLGNDANDGLTEATAVATINVASVRQKALRWASTSGAKVRPRRGRYHNMTASIFHFFNDNLPDNQRLSYEPYGPIEDGPPRITGRQQVTGWFDQPAFGANVVAAAYSGNAYDVWHDGGVEMKRATFARNNFFYRIHQWEPSTKSVLIHESLVPAVPLTGLIMAIQIGWNHSYLPVANIVDGPAPYKRVTFAEPAASVEFEKGTITSDPLDFSRGPYHKTQQKFWWEGRPEFCTEVGEWVRFGDFIVARKPASMTTAAFQAGGVYVPNGVSSPFRTAGGTAADNWTNKVRNIDWDGLLFKHFGWPRVNRATDGWVGYHTAQSLFDNSGTTAFRVIDGIFYFHKAQSMRVRNCRFQEMSLIAVHGLQGLHDFVFEGNAYWKMDASPMFIRGGAATGTIEGVPWNSLYDQPAITQNQRLIFRDELAVDVARYYMGVAFHLGPWKDLKADHFKVKGCTNGAMTPAIGARWFEMWNTNNEISHFDIEDVMTICTDGGALYTSGNMSGRMATQPPLLHSLVHRPALKCHSGKIKNAFKSDYDPLGGSSNMTYVDLGGRSNVYFGIWYDGGQVVLSHNAAIYCSLKDCRVENVAPHTGILAYYSAAQIFPRGSNVGVRVWPPMNTPANATDLEKWNATDAYEGTWPFKDAFPFASPDDVVNPTPHPGGDPPTNFNHLSRQVNCGPSVPWNVPDIGPRQEILDRYADILAEAA